MVFVANLQLLFIILVIFNVKSVFFKILKLFNGVIAVFRPINKDKSDAIQASLLSIACDIRKSF